MRTRNVSSHGFGSFLNASGDGRDGALGTGP